MSRRRRRAIITLGVVGLSALPVVVSTASNAATGCAANNRFGRLFPGLPAAVHSVADLQGVARATTEINHLETVTNVPSQDESDIPAGYVYVGQFIDHDITRDPRPNDLTSLVDPATLVNSRTPSLDLDSGVRRRSGGLAAALRGRRHAPEARRAAQRGLHRPRCPRRAARRDWPGGARRSAQRREPDRRQPPLDLHQAAQPPGHLGARREPHMDERPGLRGRPSAGDLGRTSTPCSPTSFPRCPARPR